MERVYIASWKKAANDTAVMLKYSDGDVVFVDIDDFNRAFGAIVNSEKDAVAHDFGIPCPPMGVDA